MNAILIDPYTDTITEVEYTGNYTNIYEHIDCDTFDCVRVDDDGDTLFVDDNGLITGDLTDKKFFLLDTSPHPLVGKGLVLGTDEEGESVEPKCTVEYLKAHIKFMDYNTMKQIAGTGMWG